MGLVVNRAALLVFAFGILSWMATGSFAFQSEGKPAHGSTDTYDSEKPFNFQGLGEDVYRPSFYLESTNGYFFLGLTNTNGSVPTIVPDPAVKFDKVAITSVLISRFSQGPLGPFDYLSFIVQATVNAHGRDFSSGRIVFSYSNNTAYCGPDGPLLDACYGGIFKWTDVGVGCETLEIYDPAHPTKLLLGFERLCRGLPFILVPNTTFMIPRLTPIRLSTLDTIVPIVDGVQADGSPKVVDHVLGDFDMEAIGTIVTYDRITGPRAPDFVGVTSPIGLAVDYAKLRWGFYTISPYQVSFPPEFPFLLIPYQLGFPGLSFPF
eukprot:jgi/Botrbrau1/3476/Bobra.341_2s0008.1